MISVCIATFNGEKYIQEQLLSILPQLEQNDEIIISDDHSSDHTIERIESLNDPRIKIVLHSAEPCRFLIDHSTHNFQNALRQAKGDIIFLSDQDDKWTADKVSVMKKQLQDYDLVVSDCYVTDERLNIIHPSYFKIRNKTLGIWDTFWKSPFLGSCMAFRKEVLLKALPFPSFGVGHDLWLALTAIKYFRLHYIDQPLSYYRRHADAVTESGMRNTSSFFFKIRYRLFVLYAIITKL